MEAIGNERQQGVHLQQGLASLPRSVDQPIASRMVGKSAIGAGSHSSDLPFISSGASLIRFL